MHMPAPQDYSNHNLDSTEQGHVDTCKTVHKLAGGKAVLRCIDDVQQ